jgi:oligopeptide transport system substrate-binding protein
VARLIPPEPVAAAPRPRARTVFAALLVAAVLVVRTAGFNAGPSGSGSLPGPARAATPTEARIAGSEPETLDPAAQADIATAAVTAQLYESVTAFDEDLVLRPALALSWDVSADGRRVAFHLRPGLQFSDGSPLTGADVVGSWLRIIDPRAPSPLSSLMLDVKGARDYLAGTTVADPASVGLHADGDTVTVDLERPGADFPSVVASPTFGIVPPSVWRDRAAIPATDQVVSGGYNVTAASDTELTLGANAHYWAGPPVLTTIHLVTDIGGRSPVAAFEAGDLDYVAISSVDASWIAYDKTLGPQLRQVPSLSLTYLGFDTSRPPFDDPRVRQAVGAAVDWRRIVTLGGFGGVVPAGSMVPPGVPGGGSGDWLPPQDPEQGRALLAAAGFPGGKGFPSVVLGAGGDGFAEAIAADLERELGITIRIEDHADHFARLASDPPAMWELGWVADYPGANDFLGVLLGTGSSNNYSRWSSTAFDTAVADALGTRDPAASEAAFERALAEVQRDVPVVPLAYGDGWALSRDGLLGAGQNGLGFQRFAGLAWSPTP